jgi:hypothetical protein
VIICALSALSSQETGHPRAQDNNVAGGVGHLFLRHLGSPSADADELIAEPICAVTHSGACGLRTFMALYGTGKLRKIRSL